MNTEALRKALRQHRLERGLSYSALAAEMSATAGRRVPSMTMFNFITGISNPVDTTLYVIERYLARQHAVTRHRKSLDKLGR
jgi:hypothetical protein